VLSFDLSGKGGPISSYATAGRAFWIIVIRKPPYPAKDAFIKVEKEERRKITQNSIEVDAEKKRARGRPTKN